MSLLEINGLSKSFGGVHAVQNLEYTVESGKVHSIIGPNGAGKTTLFNMVTGVYAPTSGKAHFDGRDITGLPAHKLAALGISRSFQNLQVFFNMTVMENVMVGTHLHCRRGFLQSLLHTPPSHGPTKGHAVGRRNCWSGLALKRTLPRIRIHSPTAP